MARARAGDEAAFAALVATFAPRLLRFATATGLADADAEDVVQESFIRAHRHLGSYDHRWAVSTWLFTIAGRLAANRRRDLRRHAPIDPDRHLAPDPRASADPLAGTIWERARTLLAARDFQALWLRYGEDADYAAIGAVLGTGAATARVAVHRARTRLAAHLQEDQP